MENDKEIVLVLDRSGSMGTIKNDVIGGLNTFFDEQKKVKGKATVTIAQFDDQYEITFDGVDINTIPKFDDTTFVPRGLTALLDGIGKTINNIYGRIKSTAKKNRPEQVVFVIMTDGGENASKEFTREAIFKMIREMEAKDKWQFIFLGANQDAIDTGGSLGISSNMSVNYAATSDGTTKSYSMMSQKIANYRGGDGVDTLAYSDSDRSILMDDDDDKNNPV